MNVVTFFLEIYFAATLTISGIAKVVNRRYFLQTLGNQNLVPNWTSQILSRVIPFLEIGAALFLLSGKLKVIAAIIIVLFFLLFLGTKIILMAKGYSEDCGCYGTAKTQNIDASSIIVSSIVALLTFLHLYLVVNTSLLNWRWYVITTIIFVCAGSFLLIKSFFRRGTNMHATDELPSSLSGLDIGTKAPNIEGIDQYNHIFNLEKYQGNLCALAFVMPGCSGCAKLFETLKQKPSYLEHLPIVAFSLASEEKNKEYIKLHNIIIPLLTISSEIIKETYKVRDFPLVFLIDKRGIIRAKGIVNTEAHLQLLLDQVLTTSII